LLERTNKRESLPTAPFFAPSQKIKLHIFYEKGLRRKLEDFEKGF
jgi:hypothetical protein